MYESPLAKLRKTTKGKGRNYFGEDPRIGTENKRNQGMESFVCTE